MANAKRSVVDVLLPALLPAQTEWRAPAPRAPALETLLARGERRLLDTACPLSWLMQRFAVPAVGDWAAGALSLLGDGGRPGDACWMRADPVHLRVNRDQLILADHHHLHLSQAEAEIFTDALNRHFSAEGLVFYPLRPERWYLRIPTLPAITTTPLSAAVGRPVDPRLPKGPEALAWHRLFNELQMLLHGIAANEEREARGELPVNSLWLWGAGALPALPASSHCTVVASDPVALGLARAAGCTAAHPDTGIGAWLSDPSRGDLLVFDERLETAAIDERDAAWADALSELERDIFAPLLAALKGGRLDRIRTSTFTAGSGFCFETSRAALRRFWRAAQPLSAYAQAG
jgi:hypothetical protein